MDFVQLAQFPILTAVVLLWAKLSKLDLGLRPPSFYGVWPWILLFIAWRLIELLIVTLQPIEADPEYVERRAQLSLLAYIVKGVVLAPIFEEILFRGAMFSALMRRWGIWAAVIIPGVLWAFVHVQYEEWWVIVWIAGFGILLAIIRWKSGSLYLPLVLHAAHNLAVVPSNYGLLGVVA